MGNYSLTTRPFSDNKLIYDESEKMYLLKDDYVNTRLNVVLADLYGDELEGKYLILIALKARLPCSLRCYISC